MMIGLSTARGLFLQTLAALIASGISLVGIPSEATSSVSVIRVDGTINPATAGYIERAIKHAAENHDTLLLIELDTPGGMLDSTKDIVKAMLASRTPIAVYVTPQGAMAASAGTFITMAAQVAAMAPTTHIGSATPITGEGKDLPRKVTNATASYIETIAQRRGRNAAWAEKAVRQGLSATETQATKLRVIDFVARDRADLLQRIDGRVVSVADGKATIHTKGAPVHELPMKAQEKLLHFLSNPFVVGILLLITMYGIITEVSNPGAIFPGVVGGLALILVFYSSNVLPLNLTALLLVGFAFLLFVIDAYATTHGVLTIGGIVSLALGLFLLIDTTNPLFKMSLTFVICSAALTGALFALAIGAGISAQRRKPTTGAESMVGRLVPARTDIAPVGQLYLEGSWWTAQTTGEPINAGDTVRIDAISGLRLYVTKV